MAATHTLTRSWANGGANPVSKNQSFTGTGETNIIATTIADSVTDQLEVISIDVSAIQSIYINSTQAITLETNSSSAPTDTINLRADEPYIWYVNSYFTNLLTADVTVIYLTNASGSTATFDLRCVYDSTP